MSLRPIVSQADHIEGEINAPIELVEYGDYQCPHCWRAYPIIKQLQAQLGNRLKFVFRDFPLTKVHSQAKDAAIASQAAALQGKFWPMHDMLYENAKRLNASALKEYAQAIGLDVDQFNKDMQSADLAEQVDLSFYSGMRSGVNATPTFFINGEKYIGSWEDDNLYNYIRESYPEV